ncbi:MAG: zinc ribbon domain-containing protein [Thaumarchaeota archaeon]|nr:zinc ribbon domain-containing protein [Nitrososphaerota archaeon]
MNEELVEIVDQLIEFGYGDSPRLDAISKRLKNNELLYPSDQKYVDMLVSKYLYPRIEENESRKKQTGSLERKIQNVKKQYGADYSSKDENISDLCPKCGSPVPLMFSFCSKCGAFHDEHNYVDVRKSQQKKGKLVGLSHSSSHDDLTKSCAACSSKIFQTHEFCPICGAYQDKTNLKGITKQPLKKKKHVGLAVAGILSIILGVIPVIFLFQYSYLCGSIIGQFAQLLNSQVQESCYYVQISTIGGAILFIIGIILLATRAVKLKKYKSNH